MDPLFTETGVFLALEGGEGAGKSTQAVKLVEWLESLGHNVLLTREPGGTEVGKILRHIVLDNDTGELSPRTEALLYAADKAEHVARWATSSLRPHLTIVLDIDPAIGHARFEGADRIEAEPLEFHERVRRHFLD